MQTCNHLKSTLGGLTEALVFGRGPESRRNFQHCKSVKITQTDLQLYRLIESYASSPAIVALRKPLQALKMALKCYSEQIPQVRLQCIISNACHPGPGDTDSGILRIQGHPGSLTETSGSGKRSGEPEKFTAPYKQNNSNSKSTMLTLQPL